MAKHCPLPMLCQDLHEYDMLESNYKSLLRWYLVATRVAKMHSAASPTCFRHCGQMGTMYHIWWQYSIIIYKFWICSISFSVGSNYLWIPGDSPFPETAWGGPKEIYETNPIYALGSEHTIAKYWKRPVVQLDYVKSKLNWIISFLGMNHLLKKLVGMLINF